MKFSLPTLAAFFVTLLPSLVSAWGRLGHESVALVAQNYLLPGTIEKARALLDDNTSTYLANVALWADSYRNTPEGRFSGGYHFVNGKDAPPPDECHIHYPTDCPPEGCVISAIGNYVSVDRAEERYY